MTLVQESSQPPALPEAPPHLSPAIQPLRLHVRKGQTDLHLLTLVAQRMMVDPEDVLQKTVQANDGETQEEPPPVVIIVGRRERGEALFSMLSSAGCHSFRLCLTVLEQERISPCTFQNIPIVLPAIWMSRASIAANPFPWRIHERDK